MDIPPKYEAGEEAAAAVACLQQTRPTERPSEKSSAQTLPPAIIKSSNKPFRVVLVMSRMTESYIDSKGALQPSKRLKVKLRLDHDLSQDDRDRVQTTDVGVYLRHLQTAWLDACSSY